MSGITDKDREFFKWLANRPADPVDEVEKVEEEEPEPESEPVKDKTPEKPEPVKNEPSLAQIRISRRRLGRNLGRGRGDGIGGGNIRVDS